MRVAKLVGSIAVLATSLLVGGAAGACGGGSAGVSKTGDPIAAKQQVTAVLRVGDVAKAVAFYERTLGAKTRLLVRERDVLKHAEVSIGDIAIWIDQSTDTPITRGGTTGGLRLALSQPKARMAVMIANGATAVDEKTLKDPFGHLWWFVDERSVSQLLPFLAVDSPRSPTFYTEAFAGFSQMKLIVLDASAKPIAGLKTPAELGGAPFRLHIYVEDCDAAFSRATAAGAGVLSSPALKYWGDRWALVTDPSGHEWGLGQRIEDLTAKQNERAPQSRSALTTFAKNAR